MKLKISTINVGEMLVLPPDWKGYNLSSNNVWLKESKLNKVRFAYFKKYDPIKHAEVIYGLSPFALVITPSMIVGKFGSCPATGNGKNMLISRGVNWGNLLEAYILVGDILEEYEFDDIDIIDDSTHDWHKR